MRTSALVLYPPAAVKKQPPTFPVASLAGALICSSGPHAGQQFSLVTLADTLQTSNQLTGPQVLEQLPDTHVVQIAGGPTAGIKGEPLAFEIRQAGKTFHVWTDGYRWRSWLSMAELVVLEIPSDPEEPDRLADFIKGWRKAGCRGTLALLFQVAGPLDPVLELRAELDPDLELPLFLTPAGRSEPDAGYLALCQKVLGSDLAPIHKPTCQIQLPKDDDAH